MEFFCGTPWVRYTAVVNHPETEGFKCFGETMSMTMLLERNRRETNNLNNFESFVHMHLQYVREFAYQEQQPR